MKVKVESAGACRKLLHIEVPRAAVAAEYKKVARAYAREVRIPGFRPGRAPLDVVERRYERNIIQETRDFLVPRCYREALEQEKLKPVAVIKVSDEMLAKDQDFSFDVILDVEPEFQLPTYKGIILKANKVETSDQDVDRALDGLRDRLARFEDGGSRPVQKGDLVQIDYAGASEGRPVSEISPESPGLGDGKDFWTLVNDGGEEFLPGLSEGLTGAAVGETRNVAVAFPAGYGIQALAGKKAEYRVTVKAIRLKTLPELGPAFLQACGAASLEELRAGLREDLRKMAEAEEKRRQKGEIIRLLLEITKLDDLPPSLVEEETRHAVHNIVYENVMRGVPREEIHSRRDDILGAATRSSGERVKVAHILRRIADEEKIAVDDSDMERYLQMVAARHNMTPARMRTELEKRDALSAIRSDLRAEKTLDFLLSNARIEAA